MPSDAHLADELVFTPAWEDSDPAICLLPGEAQVWRVDVDASLEPTFALGMLSADERARCASLRFTADRARYAVSHAALRLVLAGCVGCDPAEVEFEAGTHGKPQLRRRSGWPDVRFSLSHSGSIALIAVCQSIEIGVDVEQVRRLADALPVAARFLGADAVEALAGAPDGARSALFLRLWTRTEAYTKMLGLAFLEGGSPTAPPNVLVRDSRFIAARDPMLITFSPRAGYVASLCAEHSVAVRWRRLIPADAQPS